MMRGRLLATVLKSSERYCLRAYIRLGPMEEDEILVIRAKDEIPPAMESLRKFLSMISPSPRVEELPLNPLDFENNALVIAKLLSEKAKEREIIINPIGGPEPLGLALLYAATFVGCTMILQDDLSMEFVKLRKFVPAISREKLRFLREFCTCPDPKKASSKLNINLSTVYRHISRLESQGLLERKKPTLLARILIELPDQILLQKG